MISAILKARDDFPVLNQVIKGKPLVYFDSAATMHKPSSVIEALSQFYKTSNSNVHRGLHSLSEYATAQYEGARGTVKQFLNADDTCEIVFVRGTTEAINLVAQSYARPLLSAGDEIIITTLEHHANIVPWQVVCEQTGAILRVVPINDAGELDQSQYRSLFSDRTKMVALSHVSNAIGTINPVKDMIAFARQHDVPVLVDGAQAAPHMKIDVKDLDCDFYAFSSHKCYGPTGIGVLYGKKALLEAMPPYQTGGDMIKIVTFEKTYYNELPHKFEAGTPHIAGVIGLDAALKYVNQLGLDAIAAREQALLEYATYKLTAIEGLTIVGTAPNKTSLISFTLDCAHPHDVGTILDNEGVAVRAGHHCAMPLMARFNIPATARASLAFYNTEAEIDVLCQAIDKVKRLFS